MVKKNKITALMLMAGLTCFANECSLTTFQDAALDTLAERIRSCEALKGRESNPGQMNPQVLIAALESVIGAKLAWLASSGLDEAQIEAELSLRIRGKEAASEPVEVPLAQREQTNIAPEEEIQPPILSQVLPSPVAPMVAPAPAPAPAPVSPPSPQITVRVYPMSPGVHIEELPRGFFRP